MSDLKTWQFVLEKATAGLPVMLLVVGQSRPPAPGRAGFKLAVCEDGTMEGTIGGGFAEKEMADLARDKMEREDTTPEVRALVHHAAPGDNPTPENAAASGMICGGSQTIIVQLLRPQDIPVVSRIITDLESGTPFTFSITPEGIWHAPGDNGAGREFIPESAAGFRYSESISLPTVTIIGGGHVALALSEVLSRLDFRIVVLDDRDGTPTMEKNRFAHRKRVVDYADIADLVPQGPGSYAIIMTPSHQKDEEVLSRLLGKPLAYLGMMASPKKIRSIFSHLKEAGFSEEALGTVHAPIGLPIHSHTAAEIAISIAAQLISVKNGKGKKT